MTTADGTYFLSSVKKWGKAHFCCVQAASPEYRYRSRAPDLLGAVTDKLSHIRNILHIFLQLYYALAKLTEY